MTNPLALLLPIVPFYFAFKDNAKVYNQCTRVQRRLILIGLVVYVVGVLVRTAAWGIKSYELGVVADF